MNLSQTVEVSRRALERARGALTDASVIAHINSALALLTPSGADASSIYSLAESVAMAADQRGLVLTIEQEPLQPLAMGHYKTVVSVRQKRNRT